ncbi:uncharacterized protein LOC116349023 isoform X1 [Contarinia nasturtii]|uniref:uncharacterized protein LOC116349023 isoform X1 n=1 Tax=Contarinia nasturtii TaxID=265458 RepID=UPI0012D46A0E|nr:uncharacterized protein LOC116349023 isoform X1 [Contarinia nasturtii]XP_031636137.1 uncharacterized protein LOC116349023 isoform X1 [Contarinia nasturtii]
MFWGLKINKDSRHVYNGASGDLHLSTILLDCEMLPSSYKKMTQVWVDFNKKEHLIANLCRQTSQLAIDIGFIKGESVSFFVKGDGDVYINGYITNDNEASTTQDDVMSLKSDEANVNITDMANEATEDVKDEECLAKGREHLERAPVVPNPREVHSDRECFAQGREHHEMAPGVPNPRAVHSDSEHGFYDTNWDAYTYRQPQGYWNEWDERASQYRYPYPSDRFMARQRYSPFTPKSIVHSPTVTKGPTLIPTERLMDPRAVKRATTHKTQR